MKTRKKIILLLLIPVTIINNSAFAQVHPNDNLWYNNGAEVYVGTNCLVTVQGDVTNNQNGASNVVQFTNNGFFWVQGNMYGDNNFSQSGTGVVRLQNKTGLYNAIYASESYQVINGGYLVHGDQSAIGSMNDGSFFDLELDNSNGSIFIAGSTDVRNSVDFKPASVTVDGNILPSNGLTNTLRTYNPGSAASPVPAPTNGVDYNAVFGMMNPAEGLGNFKNYNSNITLATGNTDSGYVQGKLRRAIEGTGGFYGFPIGLEPGNTGRGLQYAALDFEANNYNVISGYFQQGANNTVTAPIAVCNISNSYTFYGQTNHGGWAFQPSTPSTEPFDLTIYPRNYGTLSLALFFITVNNTIPNPGTQNCGDSPFGLSVMHLQGFGSFGFGGGNPSSIIIPNSSLSTPLPIHLQKFDGKITDCDATLSWQVDNAEKFSHFIVSSSFNGITFKEIGTVKYNGTTHYNYQYLQKQSRAFYRLTLVDANNTSFYSGVISLTSSCNQNNGDFTVAPNPTSDILSVSDLPAGKKQLYITSVLGNTVVSLSTSETIVNINMQPFAPGVYNVSIINESGFTKTKKIVKQ